MMQQQHMQAPPTMSNHPGVSGYQLPSGQSQLPAQPEAPTSPSNDSGTRQLRKRKTPPPADGGNQDRPTPEAPHPSSQATEQAAQAPQHILQPQHHDPPPHGVHMGYSFPIPAGYVPVMPVPPPGSMGSPPDLGMQGGAGNRTLNNTKRAEQNRKAQRAFRERRDAHVKALESRSQLLEAALASVEEANRRWEESRQLVEQLRIENAQLRAALNAFQQAGVAVHQQIQHQIQQQQQQQQQQGSGNSNEAGATTSTGDQTAKPDGEQAASETVS